MGYTKYQLLVKISASSAIKKELKTFTFTCVLVIIQKVSIVARAVVAAISIGAVMVTLTIVSFTLHSSISATIEI